MIDEWGNEITKSPLPNLKEKIIQNKNLLIFLFSAFFLTILLLQLISLFFPAKKTTNTNNNPTGTISITPKTERKKSEIATSSAFLELTNEIASLSSTIEKEDLYESSLVFPNLETKIEIVEPKK